MKQLAFMVLALSLQGPLSLSEKPRVLTGHEDAIRKLVLLPDKKTAVSISDAELKIWDVESGDKSKEIELKGQAAVSPDGSKIAFAESDGIRIVSASDWSDLKKLQNASDLGFGEGDEVSAMAFDQTGKKLAISGLDQLMILYSISDGTKKAIRLKNFPIDSLAFSRDGGLLATANSDGTVSIYSSSGALLKTIEAFSKSCSGIVFSPDGKLLAVGSEQDSVKVWKVADWSLQSTITHNGIVFALAFSSDSRYLATSANAGSQKSSLEIFSSSDGKSVTKKSDLNYWIFSLSFSPDGKSIAAGCDDGSVRIWKLTP